MTARAAIDAISARLNLLEAVPNPFCSCKLDLLILATIDGMTLLKLAGGIVHDPAHCIDGESPRSLDSGRQHRRSADRVPMKLSPHP